MKIFTKHWQIKNNHNFYCYLSKIITKKNNSKIKFTNYWSILLQQPHIFLNYKTDWADRQLVIKENIKISTKYWSIKNNYNFTAIQALKCSFDLKITSFKPSLEEYRILLTSCLFVTPFYNPLMTKNRFEYKNALKYLKIYFYFYCNIHVFLIILHFYYIRQNRYRLVCNKKIEFNSSQIL